jgi:hypothetical protein
LASELLSSARACEFKPESRSMYPGVRPSGSERSSVQPAFRRPRSFGSLDANPAMRSTSQSESLQRRFK